MRRMAKQVEKFQWVKKQAAGSEEKKVVSSSASTTAATNDPYPEILTRREAAAYLRMSERHLRKLIAEGVIPEIRAGRRKRLYRKSALLGALEERGGKQKKATD